MGRGGYVRLENSTMFEMLINIDLSNDIINECFFG